MASPPAGFPPPATIGRRRGRPHPGGDGRLPAADTGVRRCAEDLTAFEVAETPDEPADLAEGWAGSVNGPSPAQQAVFLAAHAALGRDRAAAEPDRQRWDAGLAEARTRITHLEAGRDPEPGPAPARDHEARAARAGAPSWRVTEFADDVPEATRAAVEAALRSSGLLGAWVFPDGVPETADDAVLGPAGPPAHPSPADVMRESLGPDDMLVEGTVPAVLERIGWGETAGAGLRVDGEGRWGAGPARGAWHKPRAEFVGAGARQAYRQALPAAPRDHPRRLVDRVRVMRESIAELVGRMEAVDAREQAFPHAGERRLVTAHGGVAAARRECDAAVALAAAERTWQAAADEAAARDGAQPRRRGPDARPGTRSPRRRRRRRRCGRCAPHGHRAS